MEAKYFEELTVGDRYRTGGRTITGTDIVNFYMLSGAFEQLFVNRDFREKHSLFKKRVAQGMLTLVISCGETVQLGVFNGTGMAFMGLDKLSVVRPVFEDDSIYTEIEILAKHLTHHGNRGVVTTRHTVTNQDDEMVMTFEFKRMVQCRPEA